VLKTFRENFISIDRKKTHGEDSESVMAAAGFVDIRLSCTELGQCKE